MGAGNGRVKWAREMGAGNGCGNGIPLCFQEQIQGLKNVSIARFDGLCCYQIRSGFSPPRRAVFSFRFLGLVEDDRDGITTEAG